MMNDTRVEELVDFWFSESSRKRWFNSTVQFDALLHDKYYSLYELARSQQLLDWEASPQGALALVILLDQIPLNIFRGNPQSFATEQQARQVADSAINQHFDDALSGEQKAFLYMPFMHSENMLDQNRSVRLFEQAGLENNLRFARHHRGIIERFGRFPHRNAILGRESTEEERAYLDSPEGFQG